MNQSKIDSYNLLILKIFYRWFSALGLAPYDVEVEIVPSTLQPSVKVIYSKIHLIYNIFLLILIIFIFCYLIPNHVTDSLDTLEEKIARSALATMGNTSAFIIIISSMIYNLEYVNLGNHLREFDVKVDLSRHSVKFQLFLEVSTIIFLWIGLMITEGLQFYVWHFLIHIPNSIICCWLVLQYSISANILRMRFEVLNDLFSEINPTERPLENLRRLRAVRNLLWKTTYGFSKCLSLPILFAVANLCFDAIIGVYYSIARVLNSPDPELSLEAVNGFFWASVQICPIVFLSIAVKRLITEISETSFAIYRIYAIFSEDGECSENENVMCWIQEFSLELFHKQIPFTAYGLFPLDCTLLFSVISTLVTYEIIAVQFKSTDSEELTPNISRIISPESS